MAMTIREEQLSLQKEDTGTYVYLGDTTPGNNTTAGKALAVWRISRVTSATGEIHCAGTGFDKIWNDRASLTYA